METPVPSPSNWLCMLLVWSTLSLAPPARAADAPVGIVHPAAQTPVDDVYFLALLKLALSKGDTRYSLSEWHIKINKGRAISELERGAHLDVIWAMTSKEREQRLLPVRIPLDKGLSGWRIALMRKGDDAKFRNVTSVRALRKLSAGQGSDWADTEVLRANGLSVVTGNDAEGLSRMLAAGRFDYFPRSMQQVWNEADRHADLGLEVEPSLVLHYPAAIYFFVNRSNVALARTIEDGLLAAVRDGSFDKMFQEFNGDSIRLAQLGKRKVFELQNPQLPESTPLAQKEMWFDISPEVKPPRR